MKRITPRYTTHSRQHGATLIIAMILLLLLTMLGMQGLNNVSLQERMAGGSQDLMRAFQAAESGLSAALPLAGANPDANAFGQSGVLAISSAAEARNTGANFSIQPRGETAPPAGSGFSENTATAFHFETQVTAYGETDGVRDNGDFIGSEGTAMVQIHGGAYQIGGISGSASGSLTENTSGFVDGAP